MQTIDKVFKKDKNLVEKAVIFGEGNFLRAFAAVVLQRLNINAGYNGSAVCLQGLANGLAELINAQNGLYTVIEQGVIGGEVIDKSEVIGSVSRCINPFDDYGQYLALAKNPNLELIISNTTEFGICYEASEEGNLPAYNNFPAKLTDFLYNRYLHFKGDTDKGLLILPCELIEHNGSKLQEYVLKYALSRQLEDGFIEWLDKANIFADTLVDRIVSGYPKEQSGAICQKLGYSDALLDICEPFFLWVIDLKGKQLNKHIPFDRSGLDIIFTDDLASYRTRKVRILNGAHTMSVLAGHMCGFVTVQQLVDDQLLSKYIAKGMEEEIIPSFNGKDLQKYASEVVERFKNPFINHRLLSIALNSVSKFKTRVLPSILGYIDKYKRAGKILCFSFAALFDFYKNSGVVNDEKQFVELIGGMTEIEEFLSEPKLWGEDLSANKILLNEVNKQYESIKTRGVKGAIEELVI